MNEGERKERVHSFRGVTAQRNEGHNDELSWRGATLRTSSRGTAALTRQVSLLGQFSLWSWTNPAAQPAPATASPSGNKSGRRGRTGQSRHPSCKWDNMPEKSVGCETVQRRGHQQCARVCLVPALTLSFCGMTIAGRPEPATRASLKMDFDRDPSFSTIMDDNCGYMRGTGCRRRR